MEWVEVTGRTIEEAKDAALDQLGVDEEEAEFEILEEPKAGLFGRLRSEARVRARVLPTAPRPKLDRRERRRPNRGNGRGDRTATKAPAPAPVETRGDAMSEEPTLAEEGRAAVSFLEGLLSAFGRPGNVHATELDEDTVEVAVDGDDLGVLIGPKGQTLSAIQELTRTAVQH